MSKFDLECFLDNLEEHIKNKLNDKIDEIDTEKDSGWTTEHVDPDAYIFQSLDNMPVNFDPILFYGVSKMPSKGIGPATAKNPQIEISVIKTDDDSKTIGKKLLRYQRALEEIFEENFYKINSVRPKIEISSLQPISFRLQNSGEQFRAIGIEIELSIF